MKSAWDLHQAWPESELQVVSDAGHSAKEVFFLCYLVFHLPAPLCATLRSAPLPALLPHATSTDPSRYASHRWLNKYLKLAVLASGPCCIQPSTTDTHKGHLRWHAVKFGLFLC